MIFTFGNPIRRLLATSRRWSNGIDGLAQNQHEAPSRVNVAPFWRNTRTEKHRPDDPLSTDPPAPPVSESGRKCVCEFCGCQLTPRGEVLKMGEAAKNFRKHEEIVERKDKEIAKLNEELVAVKAERDALKPRTSAEGPTPRRIGSRVQ